MEIKLLILDDDAEVLENYDGVIERYNRDNDDCNIKLYKATTLDESLEYIKYNKLDTAIIDLNLGTSRDDNRGNFAIKELLNSFRLPIFVISGEISKLDESYTENDMIVAYDRDQKEFRIILNEIVEAFKSETMKYFKRDGFLEKKINELYWNHLSKTINAWRDVEKECPTEIEKILSRHTVASLNEQLYVDGNVGSFDKYHTGEMYIIPPIKQHYHTGDILEKDGNKFIIINPACDIVNKGKMEFYTLLTIQEAITLPKIINKQPVGQETYINENLKQSNKLDRYHFLPKFAIIDKDYVIDFQNINIINIGEGCIPSNPDYLVRRELNIKNYRRVASISSPFLKDIVARFSAYYARQGQPNFL